MPYACTAATKDSKGKDSGRCRNEAEPHGLFMCAQHNAMVAAGKPVSRVRLPDRVEFKFNINPKWVERFLAAGVEIRDQNFEEKDKAHERQAKTVGREFHRYRKDVGDSGSPVFGTDGIINVSVYETFQDLMQAYQIVDIYMHDLRDGKNQAMKKLVAFFANGLPLREGNTEAVDSVLEFLASECWGHVHVWANLPDFTGKIKDTVNISHRMPGQKPDAVLRLANGLWAARPIKAESTESAA